MELKEQCGTCKFWLSPQTRKKSPSGAPHPFGLCRRYPMSIDIDTVPSKADAEGNGRYLRMTENGWCGEYRSKITQKDIETLQEWAND